MEEKKDDEISIDARKSKSSGIPENSDEEFSLDLSKITGFFKRKKQEEKVEVDESIENKEEKQKDDDEISIDFSKIKNIFKKEEKEPLTHETVETKDIEKKDDDEIAVDFSKIKNIFTKKPTTEEKTELKEEKKDDDEISIDLSKLKNIKNIFSKSSKETTSDDEVSVDLRAVGNFIVKHRVFLLLLIPIFLSIFLRVTPAYLPITDQWATDSVINNLRSQIEGQIDQQYPNLPSQNKGVLVENEMQRLLREQKSQVDQQIRATSNSLKARMQDDSGQTYLLAIDPYFWMRHVRNILENGHPGDEIRDGKPWDNHMLAPSGRPVPVDMFHAYFTAFIFKFLNFFNRDLNLMTVIFYIPVIISALSVIPAFFITRKITGNFGGFIAATIVAIHPSFLTRTAGGFADTDAYNVMFPLFIAWLFLEALEAKNTRNSMILSAVAGLLVGLYSFTWSGWWYIFDFILASAVLYVVYYTYVHRKELKSNFGKFVRQKAIKNSLLFLLIFFLVSGISVTLFVNFDQFASFSSTAIGFAKLKEVGITKIWPNVYTTVAEQNPASLNNVINQVSLGKVYFLLIALMGVTLTLTRRDPRKLWFILGTLAWYIIVFLFKIQNLNTFLVLITIPIIIRILIAVWESDTTIDIKYAIFLMLWFIATIYASTKGVRFTLLVVPAFAIGLGIAVGDIYKYASSWITKGLNVNKLVSKIAVMAMLIVVLLIPPFTSALNIGKNEIPSFNDAWRNSLERIKADSQPDAIINSWWDFGHWFKFWADRAVTFDGTTQNTAQAHWIGKVLLTDDETVAIGILRMLDCGERKGFERIEVLTKDGNDAIEIVNRIVPLDKQNAAEILNNLFENEEVQKILELTHCEPPEDYFITSEDMVGKSGVWAHFGSWDFDRALIHKTLKEFKDDIEKSKSFLKARFNFSDKESEDLFFEVQAITDSSQANNWIAPWPGYAGVIGCGRNEDILTCNNGFIINLTSREAFAQSNEGLVHPKKISFPTDDGIFVREYNESLVNLQNGRDLGFALIKDGNNYNLLQMDSDLTASMFTRLFYQEGIGLKHFDKFSDERTVFGGRIIVWKVDWEGKDKNIINVPKPEPQEVIVVEEEKNITANSSENT